MKIMFSRSVKKKQSKNDKDKKNPSSSENGENEEDYKLKMSESSNYVRFLQLTLEGSQSDEEGSPGDLDGYIEDDFVGEAFLSECDADVDASDRTEADEHMFEQNEDKAAEEPMSEEEKERQMEEWKEELARVEGEITTLRQVLGSKVRYASELKRKMGITPFQELKHDFSEGIKSIQQSETYQKTNETLTNLQNKITSSTAYQKTNEKLHDINDKITHSSAYQKTSSAVKTASEKTNETVRNVASSVSKKIGDLRNTGAFKSVEEKVGGAYANVKTSRSIENFKERLGLAKVTGSKSEDNFESALEKETGNTDANAANGTQPSSLPEEKVPL
ncbi:tumor protein D54-like isoform X1 [Crassostrea angulata]|uniref:tumor protein D54-like isoform X1 n=1 Tax=Magallana angulata TaxID=2784310 RepID=UPI0022B10F80|nr:tumor protein D54-like isoform X1 [Crassostrea angulata]